MKSWRLFCLKIEMGRVLFVDQLNENGHWLNQMFKATITMSYKLHNEYAPIKE